MLVDEALDGKGKKMRLSRLVLIMSLCLFAGVPVLHADLTAVGTASYLGADHKLIYDSAQGLVWLDYTRFRNTWPQQDAWVSSLGSSLTVTLYPGYTTDIDWTSGWRLPETAGGAWEWGYDGTTTAGYNVTSSELGHLFYVSLGNLGNQATDGTTIYYPNYGLNKTGPFDSLNRYAYWSGTAVTGLNDPNPHHWVFSFNQGHQTGAWDQTSGIFALAVHEGSVSMVPVPGAALLGLLGLGKAALTLRRRRAR